MRKRLGLIIIALILLSGIIQFTINYNTGPVLNDYSNVKPANGIDASYKYEPTFENIVTKLCSDIIVGEVAGSSLYTEKNNMYDVKVDEVLVGPEQGERIRIYAHKRCLEQGGRYVFFLNDFDSSLYEHQFYVLFPEFVMKIKEDGQLLLVNEEEGTSLKPFRDEQYNELDSLKSYIRKIGKDNIYTGKERMRVPDKAESPDQLAKMSDHIIEIIIKEKEIGGVRNNIALVDFDIAKVYKGGKFENINKLLLPLKVEENKRYLLYMVDHEGSASITSRDGSVLEAGTVEYRSAVKTLE